MSYNKIRFGELFAEPSRNGVYKSADAHGSGCKIVNMGELFAYDFIGNQEMQRIQMGKDELEKAGLKENDLLFARRSLVEEGAGKSSIVGSLSEPLTFESSIIRVRLDCSKCYPLFYLYWLRSINGRGAIKGLVNGTNVKGIRGSALKDIIVDYPAFADQKRIAGLLKKYDDLIENNQKQIKLLEEAAQRLYKEWFVDLRFPGHEDTGIVDGLPVGWKKQGLSKIAPILTGKKDANFGTEDGKYLFFTCAQEPIKAPSYSFDCDAVILAGNGDFNVKLYRGRFEAYQRTYVFSPFDSGHLYLLYHAVRENMRQLFQGASGSTIKFLTKRMLEDIIVYIPDEQLLKKYNDSAEAIQRKLECLKVSINKATEARDRLLPKLMSGEIEL